jgi:hypothetical protein
MPRRSCRRAFPHRYEGPKRSQGAIRRFSQNNYSTTDRIATLMYRRGSCERWAGMTVNAFTPPWRSVYFASSLFLVTSSLSLARVSAGAPGDFFAGLPECNRFFDAQPVQIDFCHTSLLSSCGLPGRCARHKQPRLLSTVTILNHNLATSYPHSRPNPRRQWSRHATQKGWA